MSITLAFAEFLSDNGISMCIRHVLVPGLTDDDEALKRIESLYRYVEDGKEGRSSSLPYHGRGKYEKLGYDYSLKGVRPPEKDRVRMPRGCWNYQIGAYLSSIRESAVQGL